MASVTLNALNKRQRKILFQQNNRYLADGRLSEVDAQPGKNGTFYHPYARCARCDNLGLVPHGLKPISHFNLHPSRPNGCSSHCTTCLNSNLTIEEAIVTKDIMDRHDVSPFKGELMLPSSFVNGQHVRWTRVSKLTAPSDVLNRVMERDLEEELLTRRLDKLEEEKAYRRISLLGVTFLIILVALIANISGG